MKTRFTLLGLCALLLVAACSDDPAQPTLGPITGQVVDSDGDPVAGAAILVEYEGPEAPPAKPATKLAFVLPEAGSIHLWITEPCTQEVIRDLINEEIAAGAHEAIWDGKDADGLIVTSGVYRYHLATADSTVSRDFVLLLAGSYAADADPATYRHHAVSDQNGRFSIPQTCLPFGHTSVHTDETGTVLGTFTISRSVKLYALHTDHPTGASDWVTVSETSGAVATITLGD